MNKKPACTYMYVCTYIHACIYIYTYTCMYILIYIFNTQGKSSNDYFCRLDLGGSAVQALISHGAYPFCGVCLSHGWLSVHAYTYMLMCVYLDPPKYFLFGYDLFLASGL